MVLMCELVLTHTHVLARRLPRSPRAPGWTWLCLAAACSALASWPPRFQQERDEGLPPGSSPPPNGMVCGIVKSKLRNRNSYSQGDQKESRTQILQ